MGTPSTGSAQRTSSAGTTTRTPSARRVLGTPLGNVSTTGWVVLELPRHDRLACFADGNYVVDPCILMRPGRHHYMGAGGRGRNLNKKMTRIGSFTMMAADSDYRERNIGSSLVKRAITAIGGEKAHQEVRQAAGLPPKVVQQNHGGGDSQE